ncbi:Wzz/FepE/Etk N-terminal domain-containing protein [Seleniivibrio woodruffii]|uniref:Subunit length determinant protein n=1 Tax=Seleniivibrio woodruffii TaxID=1078050 RepID=A0A4R1KCR7_9BACT|nr:Wzz/FepE/Etk N-terminal domain-containing protein [Seleniivibrio woodruffii]TCK62346.1 subunit length determinant protein [Seleniivibrio woodruffii]TVZ34537.1 subunit length determinant protein [Seleniivibrio woodruffii]
MNTENSRIEENEIDMLTLVSIIWKRKFLIAGLVFLVSLATVIYVVTQDNMYASTAVLKPVESASSPSLNGLGTLASIAGVSVSSGGSVFGDLSVLLNDRDFLAGFIKKNNLTKKLIEETAFLDTEEFKSNEKFYLSNLMKKNTSLFEDQTTKYITISFQNKNPAIANNVLSLLLKDASEVLRLKQLENVDERIANYKSEIDLTKDITLKSKLSDLVANLIQSKVLANADKYYGFSIISAPSLPDALDKVGPKRAQICIIAFFASMVLSIVGVVWYETLRKSKA